MFKMDKEFVNLKINKNTNALIKIELDNVDDLDLVCGDEKDEIKPCIKKIANKSTCYKCKVNNSKYFNRGEFVCQYISN